MFALRIGAGTFRVASTSRRSPLLRVVQSRPTASVLLNSGYQTRCATSTSAASSVVPPDESEAQACLEEGTQKLEGGDVAAAKALYLRSVIIKRNASSLYNLGVTQYHLKEYDDAISSWKESIELQPESPDAHTNLASAYITSPVPRPDLALQHLRYADDVDLDNGDVIALLLSIASSLSPQDPEIAFNYAAVLEACGRLEEALEQYKRSKEYGIERAAMHIRNVSAKIFGQAAGLREKTYGTPKA